jgi:hypothetical protein
MQEDFLGEFSNEPTVVFVHRIIPAPAEAVPVGS